MVLSAHPFEPVRVSGMSPSLGAGAGVTVSACMFRRWWLWR